MSTNEKEILWESISFVIEMGQPKTEQLGANIQSMVNDNALYPDCAPISSITFAKKEKFPPLQTADFLSHVVSTGEIYWIDELTKKRLIYYANMDQKALEKSSDELKNIFRRNRWIRKNIAKNVSGLV